MVILTIVFGLFGVIGGICGVWSLIYVRHQTELARRQTEMMAQDIADRKKRDTEDDSWAQRFETLQRILLRISPTLQVKEPGNTNTTHIYPTMLDSKLRTNIERMIIEVDAGQTHFSPREPQPHQLRLPTMRETIEKAEAEMHEFIKEHPFCKQHLGLR